GDPAEVPELLWRFRELCDRHAGRPVFFDVGAEHLPRYLDLGLPAVRLGDRARVDRARRGAAAPGPELDGCTFEVVPGGGGAGLLPELRAVAEAWRAGRRAAETGFVRGSFREPYLARLPWAVVRREGRVAAFAALWAGPGGGELSADLARAVPGGRPELLSYLVAAISDWGRRTGYRWYDLGTVPLDGAGATATLAGRLAAAARGHGTAFAGAQDLRVWAEGFSPVWEPRYLVLPGGFPMPRVLQDLAALVRAGPRAVG
ncbi:MAG: phosphatidylglycerol lysyltransferase domain-containing protein, partial [Deferrisomatales bacterium]